MEVLKDFYMKSVIVYCDDILVFSHGGEDVHVQTVDRVAKALENIGAFIKLEKIQYNLPSVTFMGMCVGHQGWTISAKYLRLYRQSNLPLR